MGTNTFHLVIVEVVDHEFDFIYREKRAVKIGKGGINKGFITKEAMKRAVDTLVDFDSILNEYNVSEIHATATSAVRNAKNGEKLVTEISKKTSISPVIISGLEEAEFIYFGVTQAMEIGKEPALIMDIGGGSIEFIIGNSDQIFWKESFEIGGQRLLDKFHKTDPIKESEIAGIESFLEKQLQPLFVACAKFEPVSLIGSSGTFDTLSDIFTHTQNQIREEGSTEYPLSKEGFLSIHKELISKVKKERLAIPGMIEMRVEMIVVASVLINYLLRRLTIDSLRVSAYALKEGVMLHHINTNQELQER